MKTETKLQTSTSAGAWMVKLWTNAPLDLVQDVTLATLLDGGLKGAHRHAPNIGLPTLSSSGFTTPRL